MQAVTSSAAPAATARGSSTAAVLAIIVSFQREKRL
jgi:hypothetical protein